MDQSGSGYEEPTAGLGFQGDVERRSLQDDDIGSTVKKYLEICLQYHKSQRDDGTAPPTDLFNNSFIQSRDEHMDLNESIVLDESSQFQTTGEMLDTAQHQRLQAAVERAQSIARSFMTSSSNPKSNSKPLHDVNALSSPQGLPNDFSLKRKEFLDSFSKKLHSYFVKNLEYLAKKDQEQYINHLQVMEQYNSEQEKILATQSQKQSVRHTFLSTNVSGIGTKIRQKMENKKRKLIQSATSMGSNRDGKKQQVNGLYIVGLPTSETFYSNGNDSTTPEQHVEEFLYKLFGSYGKIQRVTFYQDKKSGARKGDALIVYDVDDAQNDEGEWSNSSFLKVICSQLNGAEMPWGLTLSVELANMEYSKKRSTEDSTETTSNPINSKDDTIAKTDESDDLDTFFNELERDTTE